MWRLSGRNEAHLGQIERFGQFFGHAQVAKVDRVEGASQDADRRENGER